MFDLRVGARRHAAAKLAGMKVVPVIVREMTDREAMELTVIENLQRENLPPLMEAKGVRTLLSDGWDAGSIASRLGKTPHWVAARNKLNDLIGQFKKLFENPKSYVTRAPIGVIEHLARLPKRLQEKLYADVGEHNSWFFATVKDFDAWVENHHLNRLGKVPWELDDAKLYPTAGACTACPKRTGHDGQRHLFHGPEDKTTTDRCLDKECFGEKGKRIITIKIDRLSAEHDDLVLLAPGHQIDEARKLHGAGVVPEFEMVHCQMGAKGSRKGLVVLGGDAGKASYVRPCGTSASGRPVRPRGADGKPKPLALSVRREKLADRRRTHAVERVVADLDKIVKRSKTFRLHNTSGRGELSLVHDAAGAALLLTFATPEGLPAAGEKRWSEDKWQQFDGFKGAGARPRQQCGLAFAVVANWLKDLKTDHRPKQRAEYAKRVAVFIGSDFAKYEREAVEAIPEPASWAKLNASGTPKKVKKVKKGKSPSVKAVKDAIYGTKRPKRTGKKSAKGNARKKSAKKRKPVKKSKPAKKRKPVKKRTATKRGRKK